MTAEWFHPIVDNESQPFWCAAFEGRLLIKRCRACEHRYHYPRRFCPQCWSGETEWLEASRQATIYSCSTVHQNPAQPFKDQCPYGVVLVDLAEGPRLMANWDFAVPLAMMRCGLAVEVHFRQLSQGIGLPVVRPRP